jgi:hypothetical protein
MVVQQGQLPPFYFLSTEQLMETADKSGTSTTRLKKTEQAPLQRRVNLDKIGMQQSSIDHVEKRKECGRLPRHLSIYLASRNGRPAAPGLESGCSDKLIKALPQSCVPPPRESASRWSHR